MRGRFGASELFACRQEVLGIDFRPAVVLGARELHIIGLEGDRHIQNIFHLVDILAMDNNVEHHRVLVFFYHFRHVDFVLKRLCTAEIVIEFLGTGLKADLYMIEAGFLERGNALFVHADPRSNKV